MLPQHFEDGFTAHIGGYAKQLNERPIGQLNPVVLVEQQQTLDHAVEKRFLLGLDILRLVLVLFAKLVNPVGGVLFCPMKFSPQPEMRH